MTEIRPNPAAPAIVEIVTFTVQPGIDAAGFARAAALLDIWLSTCPGFGGRCLSRSPEGTWTDHVFWADMGTAVAAAADLTTRPEARAFLSAIAPDSVAMRHETVIHRQTA